MSVKDAASYRLHILPGFQSLCQVKLSWLMAVASYLPYRHKSGIKASDLTLCTLYMLSIEKEVKDMYRCQKNTHSSHSKGLVHSSKPKLREHN